MAGFIKQGVLENHSSEQVTEDDLVRQAQKDPLQFARLYDLYIQRVYRFLLARTASPADAEDLTSQTFLTAIERLGNYRPDGHFAAWLFRIALNKQIDLYRKEKRHLVIGLDETIPTPDCDMLGHLIHHERQSALKQKIATLSEKERELVYLRLVAQMNFAEIGFYLRQNSDTVKKAYYRLIQKLKIGMEGEHE